MMNNGDPDSVNLISLIYETAEDLALWPQFFDAYQREAAQLKNIDFRRDSSIASHLDRAFRFNEKIRESREDQHSTSQLLNSLPVAVICVDIKLKISYVNDLTRRLFEIIPLFEINEKQLIIKDRQIANQIQKLIKTCLAPASRNKEKSTPSIKLSVSKQSEDADKSEKAISLSLFAQSLPEKSICNLFIASNALAECLSERSLKEFYELTRAEARLALLLASGYTLAEIAESHQLSQNTLRNQLKSIFSKTETNRQAELVTLILSTPNSHHSHPVDTAPGKLTRLKDTEKIQCQVLKNGRKISYQIFGNADGLPLLYFHDVITWPWWEDSQVLSKHKIKLIQIYRPGFKSSSEIPEHSLKDWAGDVNEWLEIQKYSELPILGHSSGGLFALAFAYYFPERCQKLSVINSIAPVETLKELEGSEPAMSRLLLGFARFSPSLYRRFFPLLLKSIARAPTEYLKNYISAWSPDDDSQVQDSVELQRLANCFLECLQHSLSGISDECVYAVKDWGFKLEDIKVACDVWRGELDRAIAPGIAKKLESIPDCQFHPISQGGHLMIKDNFDTILNSLFENDQTRLAAGQ